MKTLKIITYLILTLILLFSFASCVVFTRHDSGQHNGWYKNNGKSQHHKSNGHGNSNAASTTIIIKTS